MSSPTAVARTSHLHSLIEVGSIANESFENNTPARLSGIEQIETLPAIRMEIGAFIKFREWKDAHVCKSFISPGLAVRRALWAYVIETCGLSRPIHYLEFGVWQGESIRWWVEKNSHSDSRFVGFDSFEGLPEDWNSENPKGHFTTQGRAPAISDERCSFNVGYFNETLPTFIKTFPFGHKLVLQLDADIYSSTLYVLCLMRPYLKAGDILLFDEFADVCHEFRAFSDFISAFGIKYVAIGNANGFWHLALQITEA